MTTAELIKQLSAELRPVRPLPPRAHRLGRWGLVAAAVATAGVLVVGPRADLSAALGRSSFVLVTLLIAAVAVLSALGALTLSIPGAARPALHRRIPLTAAAVWPVMLLASAAAGVTSADLRTVDWHAACPAIVIALAAAPAWLLVHMVRAGAPLQTGWTAGLAVLAGAATAAVALQLICPFDALSHQLLEHVVPVTAVSAAGAAIGPSLLRQPRWQSDRSRTA